MAGHETQALWALAAGELDAAARARVETHVEACASCAAALKQVVEARALLSTAREVEPAVRWEEAGARLKAAAAKRMAVPERRVLSPWALTLAGACAVALVLWLGEALLTGRTTGTGTSAVATQGPRDAEAPVGAAAAVAAGSGSAPAGGNGQQEAAAVAVGSAPALAAREAVAARAEAASTTEAERVAGAVVREATGAEHALAPGMRLRSGMAVRTPAKASAVLRLPDASRVRLSSGSDVVFARAETNAVHLTVQQGRLSVTASHAQREGFLVESAGLRVTVVGTVFSVERTAGGAAVAVLEGRVRVDAEGQPPRFVDAGERVELAQAGGALKPRALSAGDRQAFRDLRAAEPRPTVASATPPRMEPTPTGVSPAPRALTPKGGRSQPANDAPPRQAVATASNDVEAPNARPEAPAPTDGTAPRQSVATASNPLEEVPTPAPGSTPPSDTASPPSVATAPPASGDAAHASAATTPGNAAPDKAVTATPTGPATADGDFVPYPGSTGDALASAAPLLAPGTVQAPSIAPPPPVQPRRRKSLAMLVPGGLLSDDSDERFLGYARLQSQGSTCGRFLVGLGEIAQASPRDKHREDARALRGRCFTKQRQPAAAEDEYRQYLTEFPNGRYATEARVALGLPAVPAPGAPEGAPAPLPKPVPLQPRWTPGEMGSPQRPPVSPGTSRRW
ncbi:FecR domain-containing protein [Corallococcus sp. BB11-1]|uniref:FecR domain-containing protein n=1 Tax=Corallococcus sp. BB11-1 TaxID=2996783 RepID=UPI00226FB95A|nr:FecR domain-containing protein [Corallococcus sp. BB11-1]MCY1035824.1 FecR domain-containing protein [Corallococcus sp. BB11-1]